MKVPVVRERPAVRRSFRLWHLVAAVFVSALVFGALRSLVRDQNGAGLGALSALTLSTVSVAISYVIIKVGKKLGSGLTDGLMDWSVRRGGVLGFCVWVLGLGVKVGFVLVAIVVGPVATVFLVFWVIFKTGWR